MYLHTVTSYPLHRMCSRYEELLGAVRFQLYTELGHCIGSVENLGDPIWSVSVCKLVCTCTRRWLYSLKGELVTGKKRDLKLGHWVSVLFLHSPLPFQAVKPPICTGFYLCHNTYITPSLASPPPIHGRVSGETCPTVVHPVVGGCVEDPLKGTEPIHNLRVDPELVDEVELTMNHVHGRRYGHT